MSGTTVIVHFRVEALRIAIHLAARPPRRRPLRRRAPRQAPLLLRRRRRLLHQLILIQQRAETDPSAAAADPQTFLDISYTRIAGTDVPYEDRSAACMVEDSSGSRRAGCFALRSSY